MVRYRVTDNVLSDVSQLFIFSFSMSALFAYQCSSARFTLSLSCRHEYVNQLDKFKNKGET